jgi:hypothetical protein
MTNIMIERRATEKNQRDIVENAKLITRNHELLHEAAGRHDYLQKRSRAIVCGGVLPQEAQIK